MGPGDRAGRHDAPGSRERWPTARDVLCHVRRCNGEARQVGLRAAAETFVPAAPREMHTQAEPVPRGGMRVGAPAFVPRQPVRTEAGASTSTPHRVSVSGAWGEVTVPCCPSGHTHTREGRLAARQIQSNAVRYTYVCNVCMQCFDQYRPDKLNTGDDPAPRWRPRTTAAMFPAPSNDDASTRRRFDSGMRVSRGAAGRRKEGAKYIKT